jgi:TolB-like protein
VIFRFDGFELDTARVELRADGEPRAIEPQVFALLALLVENRDRLVSKDEIVEKIWDGRVVSDAAVASRIKSARQALGDDGQTQRFIRTMHRQGLRFVAEAQPMSSDVALPRGPNPAEAATRPSIAVLPFETVGTPGRYAAIADALPHELIIDMARLRWLFVTARGSSFRLRGAALDMGQVGQILGVRYVLCGTVETVGSRLGTTVELVDTRDGSVVWADRFDAAVDDVHRVREEIRLRIIAALEVRIPLHEAALARLKVTDDLDAWSAYHLGLQHLYRFNRQDHLVAAELFRQSLARDPAFARAHAGLSFLHFQAAFMHYTDDVADAIAQARRCAERGLELDPIDPFVNFTMGRSYWLDGDLESSLGWLERATSISPNYAQGIYARAWTEAMAGRALEGRGHVDEAMRLSPLDPLHYAMLATRAFTHMVDGQDAEAAAWAERGARAPGAHVLIAMIAAAAQVRAGHPARAAHWAADVHARSPSLDRGDFFRAFPMRPPEVRAALDQALADLGF